MNNQEAYDVWADNYDRVLNKTRDLEQSVIREVLSKINFSDVIEIGCGTGKNTTWIAERADHVTAIDFSAEMLNKAKEKTNVKNVEFKQADITVDWTFTKKKVDLITCSLTLEHVSDIDFVFEQASESLKNDGHFYVCELHPFKQYQGSKARFEQLNETFELECYVHHISDYIGSAKQNNLGCIQLNEWFDDDDTTTIPRLVSFLFRKT
jgi:ubiquinone/menaquinone biosynthesis C-methylase UbiE